jgi:GDP-mannose 6-dehydrogenase
MKVSIFGMGYVGAVSAACFSRDGIRVIGVDVNSDKVELINRGISPIVEAGLPGLLMEGVSNNLIKATIDVVDAVKQTDVSIVSVGTPSRSDGALDLKYVFRVCEQIGNAILRKGSPHTVIIRSTVLPGTTKECEHILKAEAGDIPVYIGFNPEFLREGTAIKDFDEPPYTIIGTENDEVELVARELYSKVAAPFLRVDPSVAEMVKYASNTWHATKIAFANEIGRIAKNVGVNGREVMEIVVSDRKLNISTVYMKPGFAYGGSCLPKDVRALDYFGKVNNISLPLIDSLSFSNRSQIDLAQSILLNKGVRKVALLGLSFKSGTDDLRESPAVELAERLIGKGIELTIYDVAINESRLIGSNKYFIDSKIPHLSRLLKKTIHDTITDVDAIVVSNGDSEYKNALANLTQDVYVLDLAGIITDNILLPQYEGIAW